MFNDHFELSVAVAKLIAVNEVLRDHVPASVASEMDSIARAITVVVDRMRAE